MLEIVPMTLKEANAFVEQKHRHHGPVVGHKFSIGLSNGEEIVGVAIVGRPVARHLDDGWTLEVLLLRERALICRPEPCQPSHQHTALRKNK
ncbi:XF1762 family protein [Neglectibacter sp. X4]|uniref:XF1762 family protein n=1 Tax=unclassified Neglectibacter TaxID=2632164 RepID=UPI00352C1230